jgi:hypothetical protein
MLRVVKHEQDADGFSVLVKDESANLDLWVDIWYEGGDWSCDWNRYIFILTDGDDMGVKAYQEDLDNFDSVSSCAFSYLEDRDLISDEGIVVPKHLAAFLKGSGCNVTTPDRIILQWIKDMQITDEDLIADIYGFLKIEDNG